MNPVVNLRVLAGLAVSLGCLGFVRATAADPVALVKNGRSDWAVVNVSTNSPGAKWAVSELQRYVKQMSGCSLPLDWTPEPPHPVPLPRGGEGVRRTGEGAARPILVVGLRADLWAADGALLPVGAAGYDGYAIAVRAGTRKEPARIVIAGDNGRGVIYGVYDFLEKFGCRWFYPTEDPNDPEVVPKSKTLSLSAGSWTVASPMKHRICNGSGWFFEMQGGEAIAQLDWAMKNRYNLMGWQGEASPSKHSLPWQYQRLGQLGVLAELEKREMAIHGPAHSFDQFLLNDDYFEQHPEWFGLRGGKRLKQAAFGSQFCWSNPEAKRQFIANAEAFITNAPLVKIFCTLPFDGGQACECDDCKKTGASNALMILLGELVMRLKTSRPDVAVEATGGYGPTVDPPTQKDVIHPDLRIVWAHWGRNHSMGYDDARYGERGQNLEKWRLAAHNNISVCQYYTDNFAEPWVMSPFTIAIEGDRKYFLQRKVDSVYMLMWPRGYWWNHGLNGYLAGRCFYDVSLSPYDLLRDYAQNYFGKDAGPLLASYLEEWARQPELCYRVRGGSTDADRAKLAEQRKKYFGPALKVVAKDPLHLYRVKKLERLHALAEKLYEMHRQQQEIRAARQTGKFTEAEAQLTQSRGYTDALLEYFYFLADLKQGLMDRNEVPSFIKANVKNWIEEEEKSIAAQKRN